MKKIILSLLGIVILFVCCDKDNNIVDTLEVIDQKITQSYQSVSVQCLLGTNATISEAYVQFSTTSDFSKCDFKAMKKDNNGWYVAEVQGLKENTKYYIRYKAENNYSSFISQYGDQFSFTTKSYRLPTVVTTSATNVTSTSASVGGKVTSDGGTTVTERGVVYSTSSKPTTSNSKKRSGRGTGAYSVELSDLSEGTTYYVRAYAINSKGTAYGEQVSFTTKSSTAKVRFQKMDDYPITEMYLLNEEHDDVLVEYWFGDPAGTSSYFEIPSGYAYPGMLDSSDGTHYYMLDDPHYYYFESGCKYTIQLTDDGMYGGTYYIYVCNVIKDGTFNLPAKVVATYKVHKTLDAAKKVKIE